MVDGFLRNMKDAILGPDEAGQEDIRPASEDAYGDPANQIGEGQFGDVRSASEDPYGDPADQGFGDVSPASEDPYGDPADQV